MHKVNAYVGGRRLFLGAIVSCFLPLAGCGQRNQPAEPELARESLERALASWKRGEQPAALAQQNPPITIGDFAWTAGRKLAGYRMMGEAKTDGSNLHFDVELTFGDQRGEPMERATYIVGTSPVITIFRE